MPTYSHEVLATLGLQRRTSESRGGRSSCRRDCYPRRSTCWRRLLAMASSFGAAKNWYRLTRRRDAQLWAPRKRSAIDPFVRKQEQCCSDVAEKARGCLCNQEKKFPKLVAIVVRVAPIRGVEGKRQEYEELSWWTGRCCIAYDYGLARLAYQASAASAPGSAGSRRWRWCARATCIT